MPGERIPIPDKMVKMWDIAKGVGEVVFHELLDRHHHPSIASHNVNFPENKPEPTVPSFEHRPKGW